MPKKPSQEERLQELEKNTSPDYTTSLKLSDFLFPKQLAAVEDPHPFKIFLCSRRSGKSTGIAFDLVKTAVEAPETEPCTALYVTGARTDAKKIVWAEVKRLNDIHNFGGIPNESELAMTFPRGSIIRLAGAKDDASIDKIRGQLPPVKKAYIDEAQSIRDRLLQKLVDDILEPALLDYDGSLVMAGTPPAVPTGYFVDAIDKKTSDSSYAWSTHKWTFFDNPYMAAKSRKTHNQILDRVLKRRGVTADDPGIRREYFGELVVDVDKLVYKYSPSLNHYEVLPQGSYTYIMGVDLGYNDADAIAILAWSEDSKYTYLVDEIVTKKQGITELVEQIEVLQKKYDISKIVMDTGGLGKKIAEEIIRRYKIPVQAAEKVRKFENIELMNDAMRTGQLLAKRESLFASDCMRVEWDPDKTRPDKKVISDRFHSDICEAVLYAWRESFSFTHVPQKPVYKWGTKEWQQEETERLEQEAEEHFKRLEEVEKDPFSEY